MPIGSLGLTHSRRRHPATNSTGARPSTHRLGLLTVCFQQFWFCEEDLATACVVLGEREAFQPDLVGST